MGVGSGMFMSYGLHVGIYVHACVGVCVCVVHSGVRYIVQGGGVK